jgi:hypothetical protein
MNVHQKGIDPQGSLQSTCLVATGSADRSIRVWDLRAKKAQVFMFRYSHRNVYVYVYISVYVHIYICIHMKYIDLYTCTNMYIYSHIDMYTCIIYRPLYFAVTRTPYLHFAGVSVTMRGRATGGRHSSVRAKTRPSSCGT